MSTFELSERTYTHERERDGEGEQAKYGNHVYMLYSNACVLCVSVSIYLWQSVPRQ
jgi:hypothetical protein